MPWIIRGKEEEEQRRRARQTARHEPSLGREELVLAGALHKGANDFQGSSRLLSIHRLLHK
jgi:hypothetical protein